MSSRTGLVMTGGGARAAYQVGAVRAVSEICKHQPKLFEVISGNSAGAINATYLAANAENWDLATQNLGNLWAKLESQYVYDLRIKKISELGMKLVSGAFSGGQRSANPVNFLLDTKPLRKLLDREVNFDDIHRNIDKGHLRGISLSTTNYNSGSSVIFYQGHKEIEDWSRSDRFSAREDLSINHLMASAAIPFFFPPVQVGQSYFGDGCLRQTTPLSPAIHLGADKILAIGVRFPHEQSKMKDMAFSPFENPTIGQIAGVMLNAIFLDSLEADVERLGKINSLIKDASASEFKSLPILMIRPSRDLGKMTEKLNKELHPMLRYLLKGIGVSQDEGLDLLSYLAFDEAYTKPLMELGYDDAYKMQEDILRFNGV
jgi:NTE family protein